ASPGTALFAVEGQASGGVLIAFSDGNTSAPATDWTATIDWGDGTTSAGTIGPAGLLGGLGVSGSHIYDEENAGLTITVFVSDVGGASVTVRLPIAVADAMLTAAGQDGSATLDQPWTGAVALFSDADMNGIVSDFAATIYWG